MQAQQTSWKQPPCQVQWDSPFSKVLQLPLLCAVYPIQSVHSQPCQHPGAKPHIGGPTLQLGRRTEVTDTQR